jgi:hypothetical protein
MTGAGFEWSPSEPKQETLPLKLNGSAYNALKSGTMNSTALEDTGVVQMMKYEEHCVRRHWCS